MIEGSEAGDEWASTAGTMAEGFWIHSHSDQKQPQAAEADHLLAQRLAIVY